MLHCEIRLHQARGGQTLTLCATHTPCMTGTMSHHSIPALCCTTFIVCPSNNGAGTGHHLRPVPCVPTAAATPGEHPLGSFGFRRFAEFPAWTSGHVSCCENFRTALFFAPQFHPFPGIRVVCTWCADLSGLPTWRRARGAVPAEGRAVQLHGLPVRGQPQRLRAAAVIGG